jgi:hypothetical protein
MLFAQKGNIHYIDKVLAHYRVHDTSYWSSKQQNEREKIWVDFVDSIKNQFDSPVKKVLNNQIYLMQKFKLNKWERILLKIKLYLS